MNSNETGPVGATGAISSSANYSEWGAFYTQLPLNPAGWTMAPADAPPSIEQIAARAGAPIRQMGFGALVSAAARSANVSGAATDTKTNFAPSGKGVLYQKPQSKELAQFEVALRERIDDKVLETTLNFSWMPEPVTLKEALSKLGAHSTKELLKKISEGDPNAQALGFRPDLRSFLSARINEAEVRAAKEVALEIIDARVANSPRVQGSQERVQSVLSALKVKNPYELELLRNDPVAIEQLGKSNLDQAMNLTRPKVNAAVSGLMRDLDALHSETATLVKEGLTAGLVDRLTATRNAAFVKDFSARPDNKKLAFLKTYLKRISAEAHTHGSALDNPDILRYVEGHLTSKERAEFNKLFWELKNQGRSAAKV